MNLSNIDIYIDKATVAKFIKIINKLDTDNIKVQNNIITKNYPFLSKTLLHDPIILALLLNKIDGNKIAKFLDIFCSYEKEHSNKIADIFNRQMSYGDDEENNILQYAIKNNVDFKFIKIIIDNISTISWIKFDPLIKSNIYFETYLHMLLKKCIQRPNLLSEDVLYIFKSGATLNSILTKHDDNDDNILDLLKILNSVVNSLGYDNTIVKQMIIFFYKNHMDLLLAELTDDEEQDIKIIEDIFGNINYRDEDGSLLLFCTNLLRDKETRSEKDINEVLFGLKKLLKLGADPNLNYQNGMTFIHECMCYVGGKNLLEIIELTTKYSIYPYKDKITLSSLKYRDITEEEIKNMCRRLFFEDCKLPNLIDDEPKNSELFFYIIYIETIDDIKKQLGLNNIELEDNFKRKYDDLYAEIMYQISCIIDLFFYTYDDFTNKISEKIIENRQKCISNSSDKITLSEILETIKLIVIDEHNKILKEIEENNLCILKKYKSK